LTKIFDLKSLLKANESDAGPHFNDSLNDKMTLNGGTPVFIFEFSHLIFLNEREINLQNV